MDPASSQPHNDRILMLETANGPYTIFVEKMQQGAVATATDGTILHCNRRFAEMLERPVDEVIGASVYRFLAAPSQVAYAEVIGSGSGQGEFALLRSDGSVVPVHVAVNAVQDSGAAAYLIVTDLTEHLAGGRAEQLAELERELEERKRIEETLRLSEARIAESSRRKDEFLAVLSHELRGPLAPIQNALHVLQRDPNGPLARQAREIIERQAMHMAHLTDDLLDLSRISNGTIALRRERLNLTELHRRDAEDYRPHLEAARLELDKHWRPEMVICDIGLPGRMDGYAVAEALRQDFPRGSAFMIALTGYGQHEDQLRSHQAGFDFHLTKPADPKELEKLLASISNQI